MVFLLFSILSLCSAIDTYDFNTPSCSGYKGLSNFNPSKLDGKRFYMHRMRYPVPYDISECPYYQFGEYKDGETNYTFTNMFKDGYYYGNELTIKWDLRPDRLGHGALVEAVSRELATYLQIVATDDLESYYVLFYCDVSVMEIFSTDPLFDPTPYLHYFYEQGYKDEEITKFDQSYENCGDYILRVN